jgi:hypothetical protein
MMKKFFILTICFLFYLVSGVWAQGFPSDYWHDGKLVLMSEDTLRGALKYDMESDLVQINTGGQIQAFSSRKILYFEIFDEGVRGYRSFFALPYKVKPNYSIPILFELLYEGEITLLCREVIVQENIPQYDYYGRGMFSHSRQRLMYEYYFLTEKGKIVQYQMKKRELLDIMKKRSSEVKQYMKKNKLRYDRRADLVRITAFYNSLFKE